MSWRLFLASVWRPFLASVRDFGNVGSERNRISKLRHAWIVFFSCSLLEVVEAQQVLRRIMLDSA